MKRLVAVAAACALACSGSSDKSDPGKADAPPRLTARWAVAPLDEASCGVSAPCEFNTDPVLELAACDDEHDAITIEGELVPFGQAFTGTPTYSVTSTSFDPAGSCLSAVPAFTFFGLTPGVSYSLALRVRDAGGLTWTEPGDVGGGWVPWTSFFVFASGSYVVDCLANGCPCTADPDCASNACIMGTCGPDGPPRLAAATWVNSPLSEPCGLSQPCQFNTDPKLEFNACDDEHDAITIDGELVPSGQAFTGTPTYSVTTSSFDPAGSCLVGDLPAFTLSSLSPSKTYSLALRVRDARGLTWTEPGDIGGGWVPWTSFVVYCPEGMGSCMPEGASCVVGCQCCTGFCSSNGKCRVAR